MTVQTTTSRADYTGNGVTTTFSVPFYFLDSSHLVVYRTDVNTGAVTTLVITTDYSVTGAGVSAGGSITCTVAPTANQKISILRNVPLTQLTHYVENDPFPAATHESALDKLTMEVQQLDEANDRALTLSPVSVGVSTVLPTPEANSVLAWDQTGTAINNVSISSFATIAAATGAYNTQLFNGTGATGTFTLSDTPGSLLSLEVFVSGVRQRPATDYSVSGTTLTFTSYPPLGTNNIFVRWGTALDVGVSSQPFTSPSGLAAVGRTSCDFTGIPAWARKVNVMLYTISTNGTNIPLLRVGDSGGLKTTGYTSYSQDGTTYASSTVGFPIPSALAANAIFGEFNLSCIAISGVYYWVCTGTFALGSAAKVVHVSGGINFSANLLDRVSLVAQGGDIFDTGVISISYQ